MVTDRGQSEDDTNSDGGGDVAAHNRFRAHLREHFRRLDAERPRTHAEVAARIREVLPAQADQLIDQMRPGIRFAEDDPGDDKPAIRLGGGACLPASIDWPEHEGRPLHFFAEVDLAQVSPFDLTKSLAATGSLFVFFDGLAGTSSDSAPVKVVAVSDEEMATPARFRPTHPDDDDFLLPAVFRETHLVSPWTQWTVPDSEEPCVRELDWYEPYEDDPKRPFWRRAGDLDDSVQSCEFQMLGWPGTLQGANYIHGTLELAAQRFDDDVSLDPADWRLLLQLASWDGGFEWADLVRIYLMIPAADLVPGRYDRVLAYMETA